MDSSKVPPLRSDHRLLPILVFVGLSVLFLIRLVNRLLRPVRCQCDICQAYLTSSWTSQFRNLSDWYAHLLLSSPTQTIHLHVLNNTITTNPKNVEYILRTNFDNYPKGKPFSAILGDLLGKGIFNVDGHFWAFQRKLASLELGSITFRSFAFDVVATEITTRLLPLFSSVSEAGETGDSPVLDLQDVFRRFSFDVICKLSFGLDPGCLELSLPLSEFAESFDLATRLSAERALAPMPLIWKAKRAFGLGKERELRRAITKLDLLAKEVKRQKRKLGFRPNQHDLLDRFMGSLDDEKHLRDIVISFILAGRDTVASALTAFFWVVSKHPDVRAKILEERNRVVFGSVEQVRSMHYLHAAVYECMRLYPPVQFDSKFALRDDILPDKTSVKGGTLVTYHSSRADGADGESEGRAPGGAEGETGKLMASFMLLHCAKQRRSSHGVCVWGGGGGGGVVV